MEDIEHKLFRKYVDNINRINQIIEKFNNTLKEIISSLESNIIDIN